MDHHNKKTGLCNPSELTLAKAVGRGERTVRKAIRELESAGLIGVRRSGTRQGSNRYTLHILYRQEIVERPAESFQHNRQNTAAKTIKETKKKTFGNHCSEQRRHPTDERKWPDHISDKERGMVLMELATMLGEGTPDYVSLRNLDHSLVVRLLEGIHDGKMSLEAAAIEMRRRS